MYIWAGQKFFVPILIKPEGDNIMNIYSVAIDGPAGSGKSTVARLLAKELNITYIDTGAMYRTVALYCINNGVDTKNRKDVVKALNSVQMDIKQENGGQKIFLSGVDVTNEIRSQRAGAGASDVAVIKEVREKLVDMQRKMSQGMSVVMDGRDIGTNVLLNAPVKIFLSASAEERAKRRCGELDKLGLKYDFESVKKQIEQRDFNDMNREFNPLKKADDAVEIDTTFLSIEQVKNKIIDIIKQKTGMK